MIWTILAFTPTILYLLIWVVPGPGALCRPSRGPDLSVFFDVARAEREMKLPLAELVAQAERKAIAMHSPLAGDPRQAQVVANPVATEQVVSLIGGGVSHVPIEVTAVGDPDRSFIAASRTPLSGGGTNTIYHWPLLRLREERDRAWTECRMLVEPPREFSRQEQCNWNELNDRLSQLDKQIAYYQRMADHL